MHAIIEFYSGLFADPLVHALATGRQILLAVLVLTAGASMLLLVFATRGSLRQQRGWVLCITGGSLVFAVAMLMTPMSAGDDLRKVLSSEHIEVAIKGDLVHVSGYETVEALGQTARRKIGHTAFSYDDLPRVNTALKETHPGLALIP